AQQNAAYEDEQAKPGDAHHLDPNGLRPAHIAATAAKTREGFPTPPVQLPEATMADKLVDWPCTTVEQDEDCAVGYPSLFCGACEGTGRAPEATVIALAPEMLRIASEIGEPEDPFAAWESIDLIKSQNDQLRRVLNKTGDWINSLPVPTSCATRMFGLVRAAANEVIGGMNDQGSNRE